MKKKFRPLLPAAAAVLLAAALTPATAAAEGADQSAPAEPASPAASPCGARGVLAAATGAAPTCSYDAVGTDVFTVPDGVTAVTVALYGAEGGSAAGFVAPNPPNEGAPGGLGGETRGTLAVTPGQTLQLTVGAAGIPGSSRKGEYARPGGYGHGSGGGGAHGGGGSGGGATDLRTGAFGPYDRVMVAGAGGGAGNGGPLLHGGDGGGPEGEPGGQGGGPEGSGLAGGGGTQATAGAGGPRNSNLGAPGAPGGDIDNWYGTVNPGSGGSGGNGARGGNGGGGGGGGWQGGGGGSGGGNPDNLYAAGGGGGSGHTADSVRDASLRAGVQHGGGKALISFRYGSTVRLAADEGTPLFGRPVTLTADVEAANPAAGTPSGTVEFRDGEAVLGTATLENGRARLRTGTLRPGTHSFTARFAGADGLEPAVTAAPTDVTVGFSGPCLTGSHRGALTVGAGEALCIGAGATQTGPVRVQAGGALAVTGAAIAGPFSAEGALALTVCGTSVSGPLSIGGTTGRVLAGTGADGAEACAANTVVGAVTVERNTGGVELSGARVTGPLRCTGNDPAPRLDGVTATGPRTGQCED
ncbi:Ig-like domain-containing protein [Streptomyces sp. NPDC089799]|uniref:Ig-like domain-containing protein n=1 Tax=Streptomyces sp. NPDC089799 TaxID=3155066 RepID=UPI003445E9C8